MSHPFAFITGLTLRPLFFKSLAAFSLLLFPLQSLNSAPSFSSLKPAILLTSEWNGREHQKEFPCSGMIHSYLTFATPLVGDHLLEGIWRMPNGTVGEHTRAPISFAEPGRRTAYLFLQFEESGGGSLGFRDASDVERQEANKIYDGLWSLDVLIDGEIIGQSKFNVSCTLG